MSEGVELLGKGKEKLSSPQTSNVYLPHGPPPLCLPCRIFGCGHVYSQPAQLQANPQHPAAAHSARLSEGRPTHNTRKSRFPVHSFSVHPIPFQKETAPFTFIYLAQLKLKIVADASVCNHPLPANSIHFRGPLRFPFIHRTARKKHPGQSWTLLQTRTNSHLHALAGSHCTLTTIRINRPITSRYLEFCRDPEFVGHDEFQAQVQRRLRGRCGRFRGSCCKEKKVAQCK